MKKSLKKMLVAVMGIVVISNTFNNVIVYAAVTPPKAESNVRSTSYIWKYKVINGVLHKRLYNQVTNQWIGDWIPMK